jgi:tetratricopeptide (TPR) repeat protein
MAVVKRSFFLWALLAVLTLALAGCGGSGEEEVKETAAGEQVESMEPESIYLQRADSLRWRGYLAFAPQDTALAWIMMASLYLANNYPEAALYYLDLASHFDLDRPVIYLNMGYAYNMLGNYEKAAESFHMFVQRDPGSILSQEIFRIVEKYHAITKQVPE